MARPKHRSEDGRKPHRLLLGTPNGLVEWDYGTASDARDRIRTYLLDVENYAMRYNAGLLLEVQEMRRLAINADFPTGRDHLKEWSVTDQLTGLTWVVKLWKEK